MIDRIGEARYRVLLDDTEAYALARRLDEERMRAQAAEAASRAKSEFLSAA